MAKKIGKKLDKKPDIMAENEPKKQAEIVHANQSDKKIHIAVVLLALVVLGCVVIIGSNLLNASQSPELPADTNTTLILNASQSPELPADTNTTLILNASQSPELPADTNTTLTAIYFFGNGCSACEKVKPLIADIQARYPELHIEMLEVNDNRTNWDKFVTMRQNGFNNTRWAIPTIFIGKNALVGQTEIKDHFEEYILAEKQRIATGNPLN
jgi:thiol-disulfide isomerase/thioredoxin